MRRGRRTALAAVTTCIVLGGSGAAYAAAPSIVNTPGATWMESASGNDDVRSVSVTFVVRHDVGRRITGIVRDTDFNGTDNTGTAGTTSVAPQEHVSGRTTSSVVRHTFAPPRPDGFSCGLSATRRVDVPLRFRVVDDAGQRSGSVTQNWHVVENGDCLGRTDFPVLEAWGGGTSGTTPGTAVAFSFRCDDDDSSGDNDKCDYVRTRWRRLNDGVTSGTTERDAEDNADRSFTQTFPQRGIYVVEAELCGETDCDDEAGRWWRLGSAVVNEAANPSLSLSTTGTAASSPVSVNQGDAASVVATTSDASPGRAQVLEWDADGNGAYERAAFEAPFLSGSSITSNLLAGAQLQQEVPTATAGLKTIGARVTDNGAIDAADDAARQATATRQVRVNARPTAAAVAATTAEDTPADIALAGADADDQPQALRYEVTQAPENGSVTLSGGTATFTPAPNFHGTTTFRYRAADGTPGLIAAWAASAEATATVTVTEANDLPQAADAEVFTDEDTAVDIGLVAVDGDDDDLDYGITGEPDHGTLACDGAACRYTPAADFRGSDAFDFTATDDDGATSSGTVTITVAPVDDAPVVEDTSVSTDEDTAVTFTPPASDVDSSPLALSAGAAEHGEVECGAATCTYTPDEDFHGEDGFDVTASADGKSDTGRVSVAVAAVNDAPVAADEQEVTTAEDTAVEFDLDVSDVDSDDLTITEGSPALECEGLSCRFTPPANSNQTFVVGYVAEDGDGASDAGKVTIRVTPVDDAPVVEDTSVSTDEDTAVTFTPPASDVDDDALELTAGDAEHGTVECGTSTCTYTPDEDFHGEDGFDVTASASGKSDTGRVTVEVRPVNDAPAPADGEVTTPEDTPADVRLTGTDADGDALTWSVTEQGERGTLACDTDGACVYAPEADEHGTDLVRVRAEDPSGAAATAALRVTITPVNDAPAAPEVRTATDEDTAVTFDVPATDVDGDELAYEVSEPAGGGTATCTTAGRCTYTPQPNRFGVDSFGYRVRDGEGAQATGRVVVDVRPVNDAPVARDSTAATEEDTPVAFVLDATDPDDLTLDYAITDAPDHGTVACDGGRCTYTPAQDFSGSDELAFRATDAAGATATGRVRITVTEIRYTTRTTVEPVVLLGFGLLYVEPRFNARLTRGDGTPVAGRTITFSGSNGQAMCSATTGADGRATCSRRLTMLLAQLQALTYTATFAGDPDHEASSGQARLVQLR